MTANTMGKNRLIASPKSLMQTPMADTSPFACLGWRGTSGKHFLRTQFTQKSCVERKDRLPIQEIELFSMQYSPQGRDRNASTSGHRCAVANTLWPKVTAAQSLAPGALADQLHTS
jgi:hypothetical protein